jgi:hypothetical protein
MLVAVTWLLAGCGQPDTVAESIIYSVEYQTPGGGTEGLTRVSDNRCVPGGNGAWNVDADGRFTRDSLIINNRQHPESARSIFRSPGFYACDLVMAELEK